MQLTRRQLLASTAGLPLAPAGCNRGGGMANHVVLLGDSIFDNKAYVGTGPAVIDQVREQLPAGWQATLRAVDGSRVHGVPGQLRGMPKDASHLVVSVGGNDALAESGI